jgi:hypothetical protein
MNDVEDQLVSTRNLMLVRQLAISYQFHAASHLGVGRTRKLFCMTHKDLSTTVKTQDYLCQQEFLSIENKFTTRMGPLGKLSTTTAVAQLVKNIRELGTTNSHPTHVLKRDNSGRLVEVPATYEDMVSIIADLKTHGTLRTEEAEDSLILLEVLHYLKSLPNAPAEPFLRST